MSRHPPRALAAGSGPTHDDVSLEDTESCERSESEDWYGCEWRGIVVEDSVGGHENGLFVGVPVVWLALLAHFWNLRVV